MSSSATVSGATSPEFIYCLSLLQSFHPLFRHAWVGRVVGGGLGKVGGEGEYDRLNKYKTKLIKVNLFLNESFTNIFSISHVVKVMELNEEENKSGARPLQRSLTWEEKQEPSKEEESFRTMKST